MNTYESISTEIKLPMAIIKENDRLYIILKGQKLVLPKGGVAESHFSNLENGARVQGQFVSQCDFLIKLNKSMVYTVVPSDDPSYEFSSGPEKITIEGMDLEDFTKDAQYMFYQENDPNCLDNIYTDTLNDYLASGRLDHLITRRDGMPWERPEVEVVLALHLETKDLGTAEERAIISEAINAGRINRSYNAVRKMVHGMRSFDSSDTRKGLENMGKIFEDVWNSHKKKTEVKDSLPTSEGEGQ